MVVTDGQLLLPFDFISEGKKERENEDQKKLQCMLNDLEHFPDPKTDNERLLELQYQFRSNGNKNLLKDIYELSKEICLKLINKEVRRNKHIKAMQMTERRIKASDAATYILEQFLAKPFFYIKKSFTGYLYLRVQHELYYKRKVDEIVEFVDLSEFLGENDEDDEENYKNPYCHDDDWLHTGEN